jgi:spore coat polysaccharide biosynthesis protein SpsF
MAKADVVVRITADCPVIDPALIDNVVNTLLDDKYDFVCNRLPPPWPRTFPIGLDVEACTFKVLKKAWKEATEPHHREHVMPYLYDGVELTHQSRTLETGTSPRGFKIALLDHTTDFGDYRWTVDTQEDLIFIREIFSRLAGKSDFTWYDVLEIVHKDPNLAKINADIRHNVMTDVDERNKNS